MTLLTLMKIQTKITIRSHFICIQFTKTKVSYNIQYGSTGSLICCQWKCKAAIPLEKSMG